MYQVQEKANGFGEAETCQELDTRAGDPTLGKTGKCNKTWTLSPRKLLLSDIFRSVEAWPAAGYLLLL